MESNNNNNNDGNPHSSPPPKTTPARRRQGRNNNNNNNNARSAGQKTYASENDVPSFVASRPPRAPQTPDKNKTSPASPAPVSVNTDQAGSKQRSRNTIKSKAKNTPTSPEPSRPKHSGDQSSPHMSPTMKPSSGPAFAGATFHASPAPSALPIPSFLAQTSGSSPIARNPNGVTQEPSPPATDTDAPTPYRTSSMPATSESPLDWMFRAHREEKKLRENGPSQALHALGAASPCNSPSAPTPSQTRRSYNRQSISRIDSSELDGKPGQLLGPAFSTPYQDRIRAARASSASRPTALNPRSPREVPHPASEDPTEALKKFLFGGALASSPNVPISTATPTSYAVSSTATTSLSSNQADGSGYDRMGSLQDMENDLRRILKLDMADPPATERRLFTR